MRCVQGEEKRHRADLLAEGNWWGPYDRRMGMRVLPTVLLVLVVAAACGDDPTTSVGADGGGSDTRADETRYAATTTVLESPDHGPQLCLGVIADSYPPQCRGPDVIGWDWDAVEGEESASGTTWGAYRVVGTWDGASLTLTEPPSAADTSGSAEPEPADFETPCPEPEGGWRVVDESLTSDESLNSAIAHARSQTDVGGVWVDQSINPEPLDETKANDPTKLILNVSFTDDLEQHEEAIRELWGGALCVSEASISMLELAEIRAEVEAEVGDFLFSGIDEVRGRVEIGVPVDDGLQDHFDQRYGPGVVEVEAQLEPVST